MEKRGAHCSAVNAAVCSPPKPTLSIPLSALGRRDGGTLPQPPRRHAWLQQGDKPGGAAGLGGP